jgi:hypothetical protein
MIYLDLTQDQTQKVVGDFIASITDLGGSVFIGQTNRVPEPSNQDFIVYTPIRRERISTNADTYADCLFTAAIDGTELQVASVTFGTILVGRTLFGVNVAANTIINSQTSGSPGGAGTYVVSVAQTLANELMASGAEMLLQPTKVTFQCDVHGPASAEKAQILSTLFRDEYATSYFAQAQAGVYPLHADDPRQMPFMNAEQQAENRWVVEAVVQANQSIIVPMQFMSTVRVGLIEVDTTYPL